MRASTRLETVERVNQQVHDCGNRAIGKLSKRVWLMSQQATEQFIEGVHARDG